MENKQTYVLVEPLCGSPKIKQYESYLTLLSCLGGILEDYMDEHCQRRIFEVRLTVFVWSRDQRDEYCERNNVEWRGSNADL